MIKIPYTKFELQVALLGLESKLTEDTELAKIEAEFSKISSDKTDEDVLKSTAKHFGISVEILINSPNYSVLKQEYKNSVLLQAVQTLESSFGFTNKEAWAMLYHALEQSTD